MDKQLIFFVFGTRPEFIKVLPLILESKKNSKVKTVTCSTGQHKEMLDDLYRVFNFKPDIDFRLMKSGQNLADAFLSMFGNLIVILRKFKPKWVVVQGDTTSACAAAMAAFYERINVAHIEAGLRTYDTNSPYPEELNRRTIGIVAKAHFCPTESAAENIRSEKINVDSSIYVTGNTGIDTLEIICRKKNYQYRGSLSFSEKFNVLKDKKFILVTMHRRENFGAPQEEILKALLDIIRLRSINVVFPVHLNPNIRSNIEKTYKKQLGTEVNWLGSGIKNNKRSQSGAIFLAEPLDYPVLISALRDCHFLMTDSGGLQEEAPSFGKRILVLRNSTERPEGVIAGFSELVGTNRQLIIKRSLKLIDQPHWLKSPPSNPYGDGKAAKKIMKQLYI